MGWGRVRLPAGSAPVRSVRQVDVETASGRPGPIFQFQPTGQTFGAAGGSLSRSLWDNANWCGYRASFETPCGCWAAFKLCGYLTQFTGAATYGDWVERLVYNGIGAALPMAELRGDVLLLRLPPATRRIQAVRKSGPAVRGPFRGSHRIPQPLPIGLYINLFVPSRCVGTTAALEVVPAIPRRGGAGHGQPGGLVSVCPAVSGAWLAVGYPGDRGQRPLGRRGCHARLLGHDPVNMMVGRGGLADEAGRPAR